MRVTASHGTLRAFDSDERPPKHRALDPEDLRIVRLEQPRRSLCHTAEHRLEIGG